MIFTPDFSRVAVSNRPGRLIDYVSSIFRSSTGWSCLTHRGRYRNLFRSTLACKYGCPGNNCRFVKVESSPDGEYWAYWLYDQDRFVFMEKEPYALELAFPYGAYKEVEAKKGEIHKVSVTEIEGPT